MMETFPNLRKDIEIQVEETQRVPSQMKPKRYTPKHIIIKVVIKRDSEQQ